ncbi:MAG: hypothetical protein A3I75_07570 [Deltaproteobacteria bacterium RIFCSPLOWO2_02_FULL_50_16]|nr:MAG: hypothetical protein A3B79_05230 [Deltaproteobacteria bacterium RIFCSPHIGHO2_02_FULL_50_15]OGQ57379.1 MAG: hypothetical protein A3I75_07570 [Deltaproteobacteria bacterium RIFCSPLOWO2_02_FULL_50_16]
MPDLNKSKIQLSWSSTRGLGGYRSSGAGGEQRTALPTASNASEMGEAPSGSARGGGDASPYKRRKAPRFRREPFFG